MLLVVNARVNQGSMRVTRRNEGVLPPHNTIPVGVCGGVETYNERSFCVKDRSQGVQTSFYESTPSAADSLGDTIPPGNTGDPGNARANLPNALQKNAISEISPDTPGLYSNVFLVCKASGGWRPVIDLKQLNHHIDAPHFSHAYYKLSAEYR